MCKSKFILKFKDSISYFESDNSHEVIDRLMYYEHLKTKNTSSYSGLTYINEDGLIVESDEIENFNKTYYLTQIYINKINEGSIYHKGLKIMKNMKNEFTEDELIQLLKDSGSLILEKTKCLGDGISWMYEDTIYEISYLLSELLGIQYGYQCSCKDIFKLIKNHYEEVGLNKYKYSDELKSLVDYENLSFGQQKLFDSNPFYIVRSICRKHLIKI